MLHRRYLMREVMASVLLVLLALLALFGFFDMIAELKDVGRGNYQLQHAVIFVLLRLPGRMYELIPIAVLIGTLYALTTLARHSEITVLRASGMSTGALLSTLLTLALWIAGATLLVGELIAPPAEKAAQQLRMRAINMVVGQEFKSGLWLKDGRTFVNVRAADQDARLQGVRIYEFDTKQRLVAVSEAEGGEYEGGENWRLQQVVRTVLDEKGARVEKVDVLPWKSALNPDILSVLMVSPEKMSVLHLVSFTRHLMANNQKSERYQIALWKKLIYPLGALVMVALALPFGYTHSRMGGVSLKIFGGVMTGVLFHMLNGLFSSLGVINAWPPLASAIAPSALFLVAAAGMLWWVERR